MHDAYAALAGGYDLPTLEDLLGRPEWHAEAACRGRREPFVVNPHATLQVERARAICEGCPVRAECLAYAIEADVLGVWGGTTERDRRRMRRQAA